MSFLVNTAYAAATTTPQTGGFASMWMIGGFVLLLYLMIWLPQSRRIKEQRKLINNLSVHDEVITNSGILGKITKLEQDFISLEIASNVEIRLQKSAINTIVPKGTVQALK